jgi:threonine synthase
MINRYVCSLCGKTYDPATLVYRCECGGLLDLEKWDLEFRWEDILSEEWSLFRYLKALPFRENSTAWKDISMGEGCTPLVPLGKDYPNVMLKMDYLMPTLSFKDRGAVVLIAKAKELGISKVIQDSSGNGGTAITAYAARAGMTCHIYVPESTSPRKIHQIASYGAHLHLIPGSREDTAQAALEAVEAGEGFYASHVYNPFFYQGTKTYAYELYEQLRGEAPDTLIIPVGNGTLLLGAYYGFRELYDLGLIGRIPRIIAVQAQGCAPVHKAHWEKRTAVIPVSNTGTLAEGIAIADPKRGRQILEAIRSTEGEVVLAPEEKIKLWRSRLAQRGFHVEPTTAATLAAFMEAYPEEEDLRSLGRVIIPLCGAGLKGD